CMSLHAIDVHRDENSGNILNLHTTILVYMAREPGNMFFQYFIGLLYRSLFKWDKPKFLNICQMLWIHENSEIFDIFFFLEIEGAKYLTNGFHGKIITPVMVYVSSRDNFLWASRESL
ncbi:hypothetical protein ACJX0J_023572, partial [Zea mays]